MSVTSYKVFMADWISFVSLILVKVVRNNFLCGSVGVNHDTIFSSSSSFTSYKLEVARLCLSE